ncbi:hypothetical protein DRO60_01540 [Candidatus Bathyarchaeota archaeon]|nr:MAG: hypothetical protein DRO60_01540 [Candidatus Bathyarchaeota archaeon]
MTGTTYPVGPLSYERTVQAVSEALASQMPDILLDAVGVWCVRFFNPGGYDSPLQDMGKVLYLDSDYINAIISETGYFTRPGIHKYNFATGRSDWFVEMPNSVGGLDAAGGKVVAAGRKEIKLIKLADGSVLKTIADVGDMTMGNVYEVMFDPEDDNVIYFTDTWRHVLVKHNLETGEQLIFGEPGVSGSDLSHLNKPLGVGFRYHGGRLAVTVCDRENNRILVLDRDTLDVARLYYANNPAFYSQMYYRFADGFRWVPMDLFSMGSPEGDRAGFLVLSAESGRQLGYTPLGLEWPCMTPDFECVSACQVFHVLIDLRRFISAGMWRRVPPYTQVLWRNHSITDTTDGDATKPVVSALWNNALVMIRSDQSGTAYIEVPDDIMREGVLVRVPPDHGWETWDSFDVAVGWNHYAPTISPPCFRIRVVPSASATVSCIVRMT